MIKEKQFEVRDRRAKDRFYLDDLYLNGYAKICGIYATGVYLSLCRHANLDQKCWPSIKKIAEELAISEKQVGRSIKTLEEHKIVAKERVGKKATNRYWLLNKSEWTGSPISEQTDSPITTDSQSDHQGTDSPFHSKDTHKKDTNSKELVSKDTNTSDGYGNPDVNSFIETLKSEFGLNLLDGSAAENRKYAWLAIKKCGGLEIAKKVIMAAAADDFYGDKIASVKKLYYHMAEIVQKARGKKSLVIKI